MKFKRKELDAVSFEANPDRCGMEWKIILMISAVIFGLIITYGVLV